MPLTEASLHTKYVIKEETLGHLSHTPMRRSLSVSLQVSRWCLALQANTSMVTISVGEIILEESFLEAGYSEHRNVGICEHLYTIIH